MSLVELILSRKEVVLSLALVVLVLIVALMLAIGPGLRRRWKRAMTQRKVKRAAKLARLKKQQSRQRAMQRAAAARQHSVVAEAEPTADETVDAEAAVAEALPVAPLVPAPAAEAAATEETPEEESAEDDLQSMLDSVFVDEEANTRYGALMKGVTPVSAEELVDLANKIAEQLRARDEQRDDS